MRTVQAASTGNKHVHTGIYEKAGLQDITDANWHRTMSLNLESYLWATQAREHPPMHVSVCSIGKCQPAAFDGTLHDLETMNSHHMHGLGAYLYSGIILFLHGA